MFNFLKKFEKEIVDKVLIVVDDHNGVGREIQEEEVIDMDSEFIKTRRAPYPRKDFECLINEDGGRVFVARGTFENLITLEKIKELEESVVLRSVFSFQSPLSMQNIVMFVMVLLLIANLIK